MINVAFPFLMNEFPQEIVLNRTLMFSALKSVPVRGSFFSVLGMFVEYIMPFIFNAFSQEIYFTKIVSFILFDSNDTGIKMTW